MTYQEEFLKNHFEKQREIDRVALDSVTKLASENNELIHRLGVISSRRVSDGGQSSEEDA